MERLGRGVYLYPKQHAKLGKLAPTAEDIAKAFGKATGEVLQPSGAYATNQLGLSEQVPMRIVYLTAGDSKKIMVGGQEIVLRKTTPKNMATAGRFSGIFIQAFRHLGKNAIERWMVEHLKERLNADQKETLRKDVVFAPAWIADYIREIIN